jgi:hypothetical protein
MGRGSALVDHLSRLDARLRHWAARRTRGASPAGSSAAISSRRASDGSGASRRWKVVQAGEGELGLGLDAGARMDPASGGLGHQVVQQRRLADACLAPDDHAPAQIVSDLLDKAVELPALGVAVNQPSDLHDPDLTRFLPRDQTAWSPRPSESPQGLTDSNQRYGEGGCI